MPSSRYQIGALWLAAHIQFGSEPELIMSIIIASGLLSSRPNVTLRA